jgi:CIC family chloride channel protein
VDYFMPLTAIFLAEITGGYSLMLPLMIVASISFAISKRFERHSMDVKELAKKHA